MSALQWALLIFGVGIVLWLVYSSWLDKKALERSRPRVEDPKRPRFGQDWDENERKPGNFDEFGVSTPRRRAGGTEGEMPPGAPKTPPLVRRAPTAEMPAVPGRSATAATGPAPKAPGKLIAFYIAEHEGTNILGPKIHTALRARGLTFGAKRIYHRQSGGTTIYSVASLTKPGELDPALADEFSTPGLSVFMQLPVSLPALLAFEDMLDTARALARDLNAELFDSEQQALLTPERERELHAQVREWAQKQTGV